MLRTVWGCNEKTQMSVPTFVEVEEDMEKVYFNCPRKFIPSSIVDFIWRINYYKDFPGAGMPSYDEVSPRFQQAFRLYNQYCIEALKEKK